MSRRHKLNKKPPILPIDNLIHIICCVKHRQSGYRSLHTVNFQEWTMKQPISHSESDISTVSTRNEYDQETTDDDRQLFFVTSYSDFDKLGECH
jgi:hypothetical protein